jgi:hypothetical protein
MAAAVVGLQEIARLRGRAKGQRDAAPILPGR